MDTWILGFDTMQSQLVKRLEELHALRIEKRGFGLREKQKGHIDLISLGKQSITGFRLKRYM